MAINLAQEVNDAVAGAGAPIDGVAVYRPGQALPASGHLVVRADGYAVRIDYRPEATAQQIMDGDAAVLGLVLTPAGQEDLDRARVRAVAKLLLGTREGYAQLQRAVAQVMIDEINVLRQWTRDYKAAAAAATSLANLQARVAALPTLNDRTLAQAKAAIQNRLDDGSAD